MPKYELLLSIEVEAASASEAFANVRTNFCVVNDPENKITENLIDFLIDDQVSLVISEEEN